MATSFFPPPKPVKNRRCERCTLLRPVQGERCPHCGELSDQEIVRLKQRLAHEQEAHANLGRAFVFIALMIVGLMLVFLLAR